MRNKKILILMTCVMLLSGCWDNVEIDRKSFISTIGIDVGKDIGKEGELKAISSKEPFAEREVEKIKITYGFPDISSLAPTKGGSAEGKFITTTAYSMEDAVTKATSKSSRSLQFGHSKLLIFSSEIFKYPNTIKEIIDYLQRQPSLNRMMLVVLADGNVEDYVKLKPDMEKNIDSYITGLMENSSRNATILPVTLNEMLKLLSENGNAIIPRITFDKTKNELALSGIAVIKDYTLKGYLNSIETSDLEILRGKLKSGKKMVYKDGHPVDFQIEDINRKISVINDKNNIHFNIDIVLEGQIKGYFANSDVFSKENLKNLEDDFNKSLSEECEKVVRITQNEFMVDPIGFREIVEKYHVALWNKVKGNWDEVYKSSVIKVNVTTHIRRVGVVK
jgi:spore germination protein